MLDSCHKVSSLNPEWKGEFKFCANFLHDVQNVHCQIASNVNNVKYFWPQFNLIIQCIYGFCNLAESQSSDMNTFSSTCAASKPLQCATIWTENSQIQ